MKPGFMCTDGEQPPNSKSTFLPEDHSRLDKSALTAKQAAMTVPQSETLTTSGSQRVRVTLRYFL